MTTDQCHWFDAPREDEVLVLLWDKGHDAMDSAIRLITHGTATHAAFLRGNGRIVEDFYPRVRERDWRPGEAAKVGHYRIAGSTCDDWWRLERWLDWQVAHPQAYSIVDLIRYALHLPPAPGSAAFCSMFVLRGIRLQLSDCKQPLARLEHMDWASPAQLANSPLLIKQRKHARR